jgi:hypothetical protein
LNYGISKARNRHKVCQKLVDQCLQTNPEAVIAINSPILMAITIEMNSAGKIGLIIYLDVP